MFTHDGIGTMVVDEKLESLREATADDIGGILQLIEPFERDGTLVKRDRTEIERDIGQLHRDRARRRDLRLRRALPLPRSEDRRDGGAHRVAAVQGQGDGERILKRVEQRAKAMGLESIFVLTTRTMHWFIKRGFAQVDPDWLPEARKRKYNWDRRSQVLVKKLVAATMSPLPCFPDGSAPPSPSPDRRAAGAEQRSRHGLCTLPASCAQRCRLRAGRAPSHWASVSVGGVEFWFSMLSG